MDKGATKQWIINMVNPRPFLPRPINNVIDSFSAFQGEQLSLKYEIC